MVQKVEESKALVVPDYLKNQVTAPSGDMDSMASASLSIPRISLKGKKFRVIEDGEEILKPSTSLEVVILAVEPGAGLFIKTFYEGTYNPNDTSPPSCASSNGIAPDSWVTNPQNDRCNTCPKNQFGSATAVTSGKKSKACKDSKRLWVTLPEDIEGTVFALGVPVTSLSSVSKYAKKLKENNYPMTATITKLSMDDEEDFPTLQFEVAGFLKSEDFDVATGRSNARNWDIGVTNTTPMLENKSPQEPVKTLPTMKDVLEHEAKTTSIDDSVKGW